jgi:hypothetical protein
VHYRIARGQVNMQYLGDRMAASTKHNFWLLLSDLLQYGQNSHFSFGRSDMDNPIENMDKIVFASLKEFDEHNIWLVNLLTSRQGPTQDPNAAP